MAYEFERLADVESVEEFPEEGASVLIEHEGNIKRCPADGISGGGGAKIPVFLVGEDPDTEDFTYELEDGRTADELVSDFEKNGLPPCVFFKVPQDPGINITYASFECVIYDIGENEEIPDAAGGKIYAYSMGEIAVAITNIDMETYTLLDHYIFTQSSVL